MKKEYLPSEIFHDVQVYMYINEINLNTPDITTVFLAVCEEFYRKNGYNLVELNMKFNNNNRWIDFSDSLGHVGPNDNAQYIASKHWEGREHELEYHTDLCLESLLLEYRGLFTTNKDACLRYFVKEYNGILMWNRHL